MALFFTYHLFVFTELLCTMKITPGCGDGLLYHVSKGKPIGTLGGNHYAAFCTPSSCNCRVQLSQYVFLVLLRVDAGIYLHLKESDFIAACITTITTETLS